MTPKLQFLNAQLSQHAQQLGVLAFNREQAEAVYQAQSASLLGEMRAINAQIQALTEAEQAALPPPSPEAPIPVESMGPP